jgi:hypothetical protein
MRPSLPSAREEFIQRFRRAHDKRDLPALMSLVYWTGVEPKTRAMLRSNFQADLQHRIASVKMTPLPKGQLMQYTVKGVTYRPNLQPVAKLAVQFARLPGKEMQVTGTGYLIGVKEGRYSIATAVPAPK